MTHDTDPSELTPPSARNILSNDASREEIVAAINRMHNIQFKMFGAVQDNHQELKRALADPNTSHGKAQAALEMAETASIGVAELHGLRRRDNRWMMFLGIIAGALATWGGSLLSRSTTEAAAATAAKVAVEAARDEVRKAQQTTEQVAFAAARDGAKLGAREALDAIQPGPIVVRK